MLRLLVCSNVVSWQYSKEQSDKSDSGSLWSHWSHFQCCPIPQAASYVACTLWLKECDSHSFHQFHTWGTFLHIHRKKLSSFIKMEVKLYLKKRKKTQNLIVHPMRKIQHFNLDIFFDMYFIFKWCNIWYIRNWTFKVAGTYNTKSNDCGFDTLHSIIN